MCVGVGGHGEHNKCRNPSASKGGNIWFEFYFSHLVRFSPIRKRLPGGNSEAPDVRLAVERGEEDALWGIPLERPFPCSLRLPQQEIYKH